MSNGFLVMSPKVFARVCRSFEKGWRKLVLMYDDMAKRSAECKAINEKELENSLEPLNLLEFV